jgi:hypothetical protein
MIILLYNTLWKWNVYLNLIISMILICYMYIVFYMFADSEKEKDEWIGAIGNNNHLFICYILYYLFYFSK